MPSEAPGQDLHATLPRSFNPSPTEQRIEDAAMWSALAIYFATWLLILTRGFGDGPCILPALAITSVYIGMHVYEITCRGHCYLCADATAVPGTLLLAGAAWLVGGVPGATLATLVPRAALAFIFGHLAALAWAALITSLASRCLRHRISTERARMETGTRSPINHPSYSRP